MSKWLSLLPNIIPEAIAIKLLKDYHLTTDLADNFLQFLFLSILVRLAWQSAIVIHGLGHIAMISIIDKQLSAINLTDIFSAQSIVTISKAWICNLNAHQLISFVSLRQPGV